jgi:hypothetical protein
MAREVVLTTLRSLRFVHRGTALLFAALVAPVALGCGEIGSARSPYEIIAKERTSEVAVAVPAVTQYEWTIARDRLARLRRGRPDRPYVERVRLAISDPRTGRHYQARGAVAVNPGRAARMILVGPGGTTALDVWVTKERFRFAVPAIKLEKRGGTDPAEARGLPIGMLRWWFLSPLAGRLLLARSTAAESAWILRDGQATVTVRSDGSRFIAFRREGETLEGIEWISRGLVPQSGEHGRYIEGRYGLRVEVHVEEVLEKEPEPEAFADPDEQGTAL